MNQKLNDFISWTGLIGTVLSIFSVVAPFIKLKETILITILVMLLLFLVYGLNEMKKLRDKKSMISKRFKLSVSLSAVSFIVLAVLVGVNVFSKKEVPCTFENNQIGIALSSFGKSDDNFSFLVHEFLKEEDLEDSVYTIKRVNRNYLDIIDGESIRQEMDSLCMNSGLLVSGKMDVADGLFYAKIRFHNFSRRQDSLKIDNDVFPIRNPDISNFSIDNQAQVLADFIAALLSYEQGKTDQALVLFDKCIQKNSNPKNDNFLAVCHTYIGNLKIKKDQISAIDHYTQALKHGADRVTIIENKIIALFAENKYNEAAKVFDKYSNFSEYFDGKVKHKIDSFRRDIKLNERLLDSLKQLEVYKERKAKVDSNLRRERGGILYTCYSAKDKIAIPVLSLRTCAINKDTRYFIYELDTMFKAPKSGVISRKEKIFRIMSSGERIERQELIKYTFYTKKNGNKIFGILSGNTWILDEPAYRTFDQAERQCKKYHVESLKLKK